MDEENLERGHNLINVSGLPLGPTFANIFMCSRETLWLSECPPTFYKRYVDDAFLLFKSRSDSELFLSYFNGRHPNINFTIEHEVDGRLSFLDCTVQRCLPTQVGTITYDTAKWLNGIITKFINKRHMANSTYQFIELTKFIENPKLMASLDVESLFTNVPVLETIEIICDSAYNHQNIPPPKPQETH